MRTDLLLPAAAALALAASAAGNPPAAPAEAAEAARAETLARLRRLQADIAYAEGLAAWRELVAALAPAWPLLEPVLEKSDRTAAALERAWRRGADAAPGAPPGASPAAGTLRAGQVAVIACGSPGGGGAYAMVRAGAAPAVTVRAGETVAVGAARWRLAGVRRAGEDAIAADFAEEGGPGRLTVRDRVGSFRAAACGDAP